MPVLMRTQTDCHFAAIATACDVTYEKAKDAFWPLPAQDPIDSNPPALYLALTRLGKWKKNITWSDLESQRATHGKTIILIHPPEHPYLTQHYVVLHRYVPGAFSCFWGMPMAPGRDANIPVIVPVEEMKKLYLAGYPNCAFEVTNDTWYDRLYRRFMQ